MLLPSSHSTLWSGNQAKRAASGNPRRGETPMGQHAIDRFWCSVPQRVLGELLRKRLNQTNESDEGIKQNMAVCCAYTADRHIYKETL